MDIPDEHTIPHIDLPPPIAEVLHLSNLDDVLAAHACTDPDCLLGQGQLPLAPPCGHLNTVGIWHAHGQLWLWCARCNTRLPVAVKFGVIEQWQDPSVEEEGATTLCGHAPYGMALYRNGWINVYCLECQERWSAWEVTAYVPDEPA